MENRCKRCNFSTDDVIGTKEDGPVCTNCLYKFYEEYRESAHELENIKVEHAACLVALKEAKTSSGELSQWLKDVAYHRNDLVVDQESLGRLWDMITELNEVFQVKG